MSLRTGISALGLILWTAGCGDSVESPYPGPVVRDSAGIEIVEIGPIDDRIAFRLAEEPEYVVGWEPGGYFFHQIAGGSLDSDGRALIADGGTHQRVIVLSRGGSLERLLGGPGAGPGEFRYLRSAHGHDGHILVALASIGGNDARITLFEEDAPARTLPSFTLMSGVRGTGITTDGELIMAMMGHPALSPGESWIRLPLMRVDLTNAQVDTVLFYERRGSDNGEIWGSGIAALLNDGFVIARSDRPSIEVTDRDGMTRRIVRWEESFPIGDEVYWELKADALSQIELHPEQTIDATIASWRSYGAHLKYFPEPSTAAPLIGDDRGNVWIAESTPYDQAYYYPRYRVFSSTGQWLGWVEIPERSHILDVRNGKVLLKRYDQYRTEAVALYRLEEVQ